MPPFDTAPFLAPCDVIDWPAAPVRDLARQLTAGRGALDAIAALFEWVRDEIPHTADQGSGRLTLRASEVLRERTGLCYGKSHLLVALLRATNRPAGLCYQRLRDDDAAGTFVLHGLAAVMLPEGSFLRIDARGNKPGVSAQFHPPNEALAFTASLPGEVDLPGVFARPIPSVVTALAAGGPWDPLHTKLPDAQPEDWPVADGAWERPSQTR